MALTAARRIGLVLVAVALLASAPAPEEDELEAAGAKADRPGVGAPKVTDDRPAPAPPVVRVSDGSRELREAELDGSRALAAERGLVFALALGEPSAAAYELRYGGADPSDASARVAPFDGVGDAREARLSAEALADLPPVLRFVVAERTPLFPQDHARGGEPFALILDREAPAAHLVADAPEGAQVPLRWGALDPESPVERYQLMVREEGGPWREWATGTSARSLTFAGAPGRAYAFRVAATDAVGHTGAWSDVATARIPDTAPPNQAPSVAFVAPAGGVATRALDVQLDARDPEGGAPLVRICAHDAATDALLACLHEGTQTRLTLPDAALPDGPLRLRARATDGSLEAVATSGVFVLDRVAPRLVEALAAPGDDGVAIRLATSGEATAANATLATADGRRLGVVPLVGGLDAWSARVSLLPGRYHATYQARDAAGNVAGMTTILEVPGAPAPPSPAPAAAASPAPGRVRVEPRDVPAPFAGVALLAAALAWRR